MNAWLHDTFAHPVTVWIVLAVVGVLIVAPILFEVLRRTGISNPTLTRELYTRYFSWLVIIPFMASPVLAGRVPTILAVALLSLFCLKEFVAATRFSQVRLLVLVVASGIVAISYAAFDRWYGLFQAVPAIWLCLIAAVAILPDQPDGYLRRTAIAAFCLLLFGSGLGSMAYLANDQDFRPIILSILVCVELNDVFAFVVGKSVGHRKLAPHTSPGKTVGGALGALIFTTALFATLAHFTFQGTVGSWGHGIAMGMLLSVTGQLGDLLMSSVKRDLHIKDMAATIPGHGGLLDRFDSLLLVAPALFHYLQYFRGIG